ncbi:hypothetical protein BDZ45DRAFT_680814 [Acephala macrosclerotiorum]|nr:hypothetical protein BDZ45DRAFT_680814 [Acephala macrosclerotiorum]
MIGGDLRKNKYNQLTSLQKAFVLHKEQKRTEMEAYRQAQTKFSVKKEQNRPNLVADERIDALRPVFLRNTQVNTAHTTIMSNDPTPRSSPRDSSPASSQPILNTDYRDSLPCPSSTGKRKRISSPEPLERVVKCGKLNSSSELNPGFALPGASICESERRIPGVLLDYDAVENGEVSVRFEREESA